MKSRLQIAGGVLAILGPITLGLAGCAIPIQVPEIPLLDQGRFRPATREPEPPPSGPVRIVEIDRQGGARAIGPAAEVYRPTDAQIAFHLARFIESVRSLSIDPVVVRQSWLKAYDFVTSTAAVTLNAYARDNDPFAKVGRETVSVEVTSVVRASDASFQIRWAEKSFEGGAPKDTRRLTGIFTVVIVTPRTAEQITRNPLGIYVHAFNWSQELNPGDSK